MVTGLPGMLGISLVTRSTSESGISITRPTSRMAARAPSVPKVMIWATLSVPYFLAQYSIISRAAVILEIQVDIRHGDAARVEEALEDQAVVERLDQGDIQGVGHHRAGGRTARVVPDALRRGRSGTGPTRSGSRCRSPSGG